MQASRIGATPSAQGAPWRRVVDLGRRHSRPHVVGQVVLTVFCIGLFTVSVPAVIDGYRAPVAAVFLLLTATCSSVLLAPRAPVAASGVHLVGLVGVATVTAGAHGALWPLPPTGLVALSALLLVLALGGRWLLAVAVWWGATVLLLSCAAVQARLGHDVGAWGTGVIVSAAVSAVVLAGGVVIGMRVDIRQELAGARRDVQLEQARRAHAEERGEIARELHDVVAHSMSLVQIQAASAPYRLVGLEADARQEFANIALSARSALDEMRRLLGALHLERGGAALAPQPQVADLLALATVTSGAGCPVDLRVDRAASDLGPVLQVTVYRIAQEGLGNVLRHAAGAGALVEVEVDDQQVRVRVTNQLPPARQSAPAWLVCVDRGGRGLLGMRERVALLGGALEHGPTTEGGFRVAAALPRAAKTISSEQAPS